MDSAGYIGGMGKDGQCRAILMHGILPGGQWNASRLICIQIDDPQDAPPLPLLVVMFGIPAGCILGTLKVLADRIREIRKGEEDAYRNY